MGLLLLAALATLFLVSLSAAQETPEVTPEETEAPTPEATRCGYWKCLSSFSVATPS